MFGQVAELLSFDEFYFGIVYKIYKNGGRDKELKYAEYEFICRTCKILLAELPVWEAELQILFLVENKK